MLAFVVGTLLLLCAAGAGVKLFKDNKFVNTLDNVDKIDLGYGVYKVSCDTDCSLIIFQCIDSEYFDLI